MGKSAAQQRKASEKASKKASKQTVEELRAQLFELIAEFSYLALAALALRLTASSSGDTGGRRRTAIQLVRSAGRWVG